MAPIGSTSSNIRRAIEFMVDPTLCKPRRPKRTLTISWTTARRETHRNDGSPVHLVDQADERAGQERCGRGHLVLTGTVAGDEGDDDVGRVAIEVLPAPIVDRRSPCICVPGG